MSYPDIGIGGKTVTIAQSDTTTYTPATGGWLRGLHVMAAGTVKITTHDGVDESWACPAGFYIPRYITKVWDTGTDVLDANLFSRGD